MLLTDYSDFRASDFPPAIQFHLSLWLPCTTRLDIVIQNNHSDILKIISKAQRSIAIIRRYLISLVRCENIGLRTDFLGGFFFCFIFTLYT